MDQKVSVFYVDNITCVCPKLHGRRKYFFLSNSSLGVALSVDFSMLRRKPTRLELKLDDIEEFESIRKDLETRKKQKEDVEVVGGSDGEGAAGVSSDPKSREQMINDRIGYKPQPKPNDRSSQFGSFEF